MRATLDDGFTCTIDKDYWWEVEQLSPLPLNHVVQITIPILSNFQIRNLWTSLTLPPLMNAVVPKISFYFLSSWHLKFCNDSTYEYAH